MIQATTQPASTPTATATATATATSTSSSGNSQVGACGPIRDTAGSSVPVGATPRSDLIMKVLALAIYLLALLWCRLWTRLVDHCCHPLLLLLLIVMGHNYILIRTFYLVLFFWVYDIWTTMRYTDMCCYMSISAEH